MNALLSALERMMLKTKLMLGFGSGLLFALIIGWYGLAALERSQADMEQLYEKELLGISYIKEANIKLVFMGRALRQALIAQDEKTRDHARSQVREAREELRSQLAEGRKRIFRAEAIAGYEEFQRNFARFNENLEHAMAMIEREKAAPSAAAAFITSPEFSASLTAADEALDKIIRIKERGAKASIDTARERGEQIRRVSISLLGAGILLSLGVGVLIGRSIRRPNQRLGAAVEELAGGNVAIPIPHTDYPNEIGFMARAIHVLQGIYRKAEDTRWIKAHAAEIGASLQGAEDLHTLAQNAVSKIAPVIGAGHAGFYVADVEQRYQLLGSYGYRERKHLNNSFAIGEGLVGQVAMEKAPITLSAPKDYIRINSGLGEGPPAWISVLPIMHGDQVLAVLEVASFRSFAERESALLDTLLPTLATTLEILDRNQKTRELLVATRQQAERMEKQAAQLEEQQVEMEAQQAELLETENWFRSIIESAPDGMLVADAAGQILLINPRAEEIFGYAPGELVGNNIDGLVPDSIRGRHPAMRERFSLEGQRRTMGMNSLVTAKRKDGQEIAVHVSLSPLPPRGHRGKCVSVVVRKIDNQTA